MCVGTLVDFRPKRATAEGGVASDQSPSAELAPPKAASVDVGVNASGSIIYTSELNIFRHSPLEALILDLGLSNLNTRY